MALRRGVRQAHVLVRLNWRKLRKESLATRTASMLPMDGGSLQRRLWSLCLRHVCCWRHVALREYRAAGLQLELGLDVNACYPG